MNWETILRTIKRREQIPTLCNARMNCNKTILLKNVKNSNCFLVSPPKLHKSFWWFMEFNKYHGYSNHLNTKHLKSEHLTFRTLFCTVFKSSYHVIRRTIRIPDILNHKTGTFSRFSYHHSKSRPFNNWAHLDHSNTRLVWYSDGYCIFKQVWLSSY